MILIAATKTYKLLDPLKNSIFFRLHRLFHLQMCPLRAGFHRSAVTVVASLVLGRYRKSRSLQFSLQQTQLFLLRLGQCGKAIDVLLQHVVLAFKLIALTFL